MSRISGSSSGAPTSAQYIVGSADGTLSAERVVTDTATVAWDLATASQAKANVPDDAITYAKIQNVSAASRLLGRGAGGGAGDTQEITLGTNLSMSGTTLNAAASAPSATTVEVNLGSSVVFAGKFTITDAAISGTSKILCWQAPGPYTNKGTRADEADLQPVQVIAVEPGAGSAVVKWQTPPMISTAIQLPNWTQPGSVISTTDKNRDPRQFAFRLGKVRGNVKFTYMVLA